MLSAQDQMQWSPMWPPLQNKTKQNTLAQQHSSLKNVDEADHLKCLSILTLEVPQKHKKLTSAKWHSMSTCSSVIYSNFAAAFHGLWKRFSISHILTGDGGSERGFYEGKADALIQWNKLKKHHPLHNPQPRLVVLVMWLEVRGEWYHLMHVLSK